VDLLLESKENRKETRKGRKPGNRSKENRQEVKFFGECASKGGNGKEMPATADPTRVPLHNVGLAITGCYEAL